MMHLRIADKILIHLYDYRIYEDRYEYPFEITQQGIAEKVGISTAHVPRNIKKLVDAGLIYTKKGHVTGKKKRVTVYFLTSKGVIEAKKIIDEIETKSIRVGDHIYTIKDLKKMLSLPILEIIYRVENGEIYDLIHKKNRIVFREVDVETKIFVDREEELQKMLSWYSKGKVLSIVGSRGIGKTTLLNRFLQIAEPKENILWFHLYEGRSWESIKYIFKNLFGEENVLNILRNNPTLLIFDNYFQVSDSLVSALRYLIRENLKESKLIVCMRADTPFYNRFYTLSDVAEEVVNEIKLQGLPYEAAQQLLPNIKDKALKHIYRLTKGNPLVLTAIRENNLDNVEFLTPDQKHILKYLSSQKKE